jgi:hypothetical protein
LETEEFKDKGDMLMTSSAVGLDPVSNAPAAVLMQDALNVMDSSGSVVFASMSGPHGQPEGTDSADAMHEDEQLLFCSKDVVGGYLSLKLMELSLFETKEQNVSTLIPHLASATVSWYMPLHQLQPKISYSSEAAIVTREQVT